ncbi:MAG: Zn-ribbon domain-containing OB-fold protein [Desulfomonilia bacterium]
MSQREFSDISFREYLSEEKLMGSKCRDCSIIYTPPRSICTKCYGSNMEWENMKGTGRLVAFTCISIGPKAMIEEGYNRQNPYCVGVVELDEGTKVVARIEGVDPKKPEEIRVGMPLRVKFLHKIQEGEKRTILAFEAL